MHEWTNSRFYNFVSWASVALMIGLTMALVALVDPGHDEDVADDRRRDRLSYLFRNRSTPRLKSSVMRA